MPIAVDRREITKEFHIDPLPLVIKMKVEIIISYDQLKFWTIVTCYFPQCQLLILQDHGFVNESKRSTEGLPMSQKVWLLVLHVVKARRVAIIRRRALSLSYGSFESSGLCLFDIHIVK